MSEPYLSEIKMMGFNFAPRGWAFCDGQLLPINQNQALFSLLGTNYGGDGRTTFALPDLRGRSPRKGGGGNTRLGGRGGVETVTLTSAQLPSHSHNVQVNGASSDSQTPEGTYLGKGTAPTLYHKNPPTAVNMAKGTVMPVGGQQSHDNMQPFVTLNFCIALRGVFPSRS